MLQQLQKQKLIGIQMTPWHQNLFIHPYPPQKMVLLTRPLAITNVLLSEELTTDVHANKKLSLANSKRVRNNVL